MNLKENYARFFGDSTQPVVESTKYRMNEAQSAKWIKLCEAFKKQFPSKQLSIKEGYVKVNGHIVEKIETFIDKNPSQIVNLLSNTAKKL